MSITIHAAKRLGALRASDPASAEALASIPDGAVVRAEITLPSKRSIAQHRMYFALLNVAADQLGWSTDALLQWCKIAVGHCDIVVEPHTGEVHFIPKSISFSRLDQAGFDDFFSRSVDAVLARLLPHGTSKGELIEEIHARIGDTQTRRAA